jgi:SnoaL-like polyketide cyclase
MSAENKALVRRWFEEVWNQGRAASIDEMLASDAVVHGLGPSVRGPSEFKPFQAMYRGAFPDIDTGRRSGIHGHEQAGSVQGPNDRASS